ncbi:NADH-quinone oxidoreductase subunit NuoH [Candidatus Sumerlaeota bacterium]
MNNIPDMVKWLADWLGVPASLSVLVYAAGILVACCIMLGIVLACSIVWTWAERRVSGRIQSRIGPNRVGPQGLLQPFADGIKLICKEDLVPASADWFLFALAPLVVFVGAFVPFAALPFSDKILASHINLGIYFVLSFAALEVIGVLMAGWASNSKWSLYGGMRLAAQMMSYEIPMGLAVLTIVVSVGSLNLADIANAQAEIPILSWHIFNYKLFPWGFIAAIIFFVAGLASAKRLPFDLPEAESELVSGFHTEYSGIRFAIFFMAEYGAMFMICVATSVLFLGAWHMPIPRGVFGLAEGGVLYEVVGALNMALKSSFLMFAMIWIRWTFPRIRIDQVMYMCLKVMLPFSMVCLLGATMWTLWLNPPEEAEAPAPSETQQSEVGIGTPVASGGLGDGDQ